MSKGDLELDREWLVQSCGNNGKISGLGYLTDDVLDFLSLRTPLAFF